MFFVASFYKYLMDTDQWKPIAIQALLLELVSTSLYIEG